MKKTLAFVIGIAFALLTGCSENASFVPDDEATFKSAKKPLPSLVGITTEYFSPATLPYIWFGSIDFSDNGMGIFGFAYELLDFTQKDFSNAGHFTETFFVFEGENPDLGTVYMKGTNSGVILGGTKFITNGSVEEASGPFEGWAGRNVHVKGSVVVFDDATGAPLELSSTFQIN